MLERNRRYVLNSKIQIDFDNRASCREIVNQIVKPSIFAQGIRAEIMQIKSMIQKVRFEIGILLVKGYETPAALHH